MATIESTKGQLEVAVEARSTLAGEVDDRERRLGELSSQMQTLQVRAGCPLAGPDTKQFLWHTVSMRVGRWAASSANPLKPGACLEHWF